MPDDFDPARLAIDKPIPSSPGRICSQSFSRPTRFLRGPISLTWLERAARLPGRALHVALAIRHQSALERTQTVALPNKQLAEFGVDRDAKRRGLAVLEAARLISVERKAGRNPTVTIIELE
jgi:hypothetical protein